MKVTLFQHNKLVGVLAIVLLGGLMAIMSFNPIAHANRIHHHTTVTASHKAKGKKVATTHCVSSITCHSFARITAKKVSTTPKVTAKKAITPTRTTAVTIPSLPFTGADPTLPAIGTAHS